MKKPSVLSFAMSIAIAICFLIPLPTLSQGSASMLVQDGTLAIPRTFKDETQLPSPEAAQMNRYIDSPVSYSTGALSVSVPLYDMKVGKYSMPIYLGYHGSGIKADDENCHTGLGWSLFAGGRITRTVHGRPDEAQKFSLHTASDLMESNDVDYIKDVLHRRIDANYDRYDYSFAGYSGTFFVVSQKSGGIVQMPQTDLVIELYGESREGVRDFLVTAPDGTRYFFTEREHTEYSYHPLVCEISDYASSDYRAVTGWYLTKITVPSSTDVISLDYTHRPFTRTRLEEEVYYSAFTLDLGHAMPSNGSGEYVPSSHVTSYPDKCHLAGISSRTCRVKFQNADFTDGQQSGYTVLREISVSSPDGNTVKSVSFDYGITEDSRVLLDGIAVKSGPTLIDSRKFAYFAGTGKKHTDLFGYSNYSPQYGDVSLCYSVLDIRGNVSDLRRHRFASCVGYSLKSMTDATGSVTTYEYEPSECDEVGQPVGIGLRIRKISVSDPVTGRSRTRVFSYSNAACTFDFNSLGREAFISIGGSICYNDDFSRKYVSSGVTLTSSCRVPGAQVNNAVVYYGKVTEDVSGTDMDRPVRTVYEFDVSSVANPYVENSKTEFPDLGLDTTDRWLGTRCGILSDADAKAMYGPQYIRGHFRENFTVKAPLIRRTTYRHTDNGYEPLDEEANFYSIDMENPVRIGFYAEPMTRRVKDVNNRMRDVIESTRDANFFETTAISGRLFCDSTVRIHHFHDGNTQRTSVAYRYNGRKDMLAAQSRAMDTEHSVPLLPDTVRPFVTRVDGFEESDSIRMSSLALLHSVKARCGSSSVFRYYCYSDNIRSRHYYKVQDLGQRNLPVMEKTVVNGTDTLITSCEYELYSGTGNLQLSRRRITHDGSEVALQTFGAYDSHGNILAVRTNHAVPVSYRWGYDSSLPTLSAVGVEVAAGLESSAVEGLNTVLSTKYGYVPLVGCTSITYPNGRTSAFAYTGGRLSTVADNSGSTVVSYDLRLHTDGSGVNMTSEKTRTSPDGPSGYKTVIYYDGMGCPISTVYKDFTANGTDIVAITAYDGIDRPIRQWQPVPMPSANGPVGEDEAGKAAVIFYGDSKPYASSTYEQSGDKTPCQTALAGTAFIGHPSSHDCLCSSVSSDRLKCRRYAVSGDYAFRSSGLYGDGELTVDKTSDSDGRTVYVFTDWLGNKVLERRVLGSSIMADTYYIYDALGNLRFVLPPALDGMKAVGGSAWDIRECQGLRDYAYFYRYDMRLLLVEKKLPGVEPIYYINDLSGKPVFMQDGNMRNSGKWHFAIDDCFGRPAVEGLCATPDREVTEKVWVHVSQPTFSNAGTSVCGTGYTANVGLPSAELLNANYYDSYDFLSLPQFSAVSGISTNGRNVRGLLAGTLTAELSSHSDGNSKKQCTAFAYDTEDRIVCTETSNILGGKDTERLELSFTGKPLKKVLTHTTGKSASTTEVYTYTYDSWDRPLKTTHSVNGAAAVVLADRTYDRLGRLGCDRRNGSAVMSTAYTYNMQGWLTGISSPLFSESLYYNQPHNGSMPQYGGNISAMDWRVNVPSESGRTRGYTYVYDGLSRLVAASYGENGTVNGHYSTSYSYDLMGNILRLRRNGLIDNGQYGLIDNLAYSYNGNQVRKITDTAESPTYKDAMNFVDGADEDVEYTYDANGNVTSDLDRHVKSIGYNVLNLPMDVSISFPRIITTPTGLLSGQSANSIAYTYTADGRKHRVCYVIDNSVSAMSGLSGSYTSQLDYCSNVVYSNGRLSIVLFDGGYITFSGTTPIYHFYQKDHLGSNRLVVDASGKIEEINHYYPFGALMGESVNTSVNRYKYVGKELDRMFGLDWQDHSFRYYPVCEIRWKNMDFKAEKYRDHSPYINCHNNPVNLCDPNGMDDFFTSDGIFITRSPIGNSIRIWTGSSYADIMEMDFSNQKSVLENVVRHYVDNVDDNAFVVSVEAVASSTPRDAAFAYDIKKDCYSVYIDSEGRVNRVFNNYNDIESSAFHEKVHRYDDTTWGGNIGEVKAILTETDNNTWNNVSELYIKGRVSYAVNSLNDYLRHGGKLANMEMVKSYIALLNKVFMGYANMALENGKVTSYFLLNDIICVGKRK